MMNSLPFPAERYLKAASLEELYQAIAWHEINRRIAINVALGNNNTTAERACGEILEKLKTTPADEVLGSGTGDLIVALRYAYAHLGV